MMQSASQRIKVEKRNGITIYSAGFWPGWKEVVSTCVMAVVISGLLVGAIYVINLIKEVYAEFFGDILGAPWLYTVFSFFVMGAVDFSFIICLGLLVLWLPYFFVYQFSPKQFWIKDNTLYHKAYLLGFIRWQRKIPFEQILNVKSEAANGRYIISVLYEMSMPKLVFIILVYWNERFTQWNLTLINGIPTRQEAKNIQTVLLEPMTASPACRVEGHPDTGKA